MSDKTETDENDVFAAAPPVATSELVETAEKEEAPEREPRKPGSTGGGASRSTPSGRPTWHLSLTLGILIALVGGVVLWLQSPTVALFVVGGLVILAGLALALRHLFGSDASGRRAGRGASGQRGATGASSAGARGATGASDRGTSGANGARRGANGAKQGDTSGATGANRGATGANRDRRGDTSGANRGATGANRGATGANRGATDRSRGTRGDTSRGTSDTSRGTDRARNRQRGDRGSNGGRQPWGRGTSGPRVPDGARPLVGGSTPTGRRRRRRERREPIDEVRVCDRGPHRLVKTTKDEDRAIDAGKRTHRLKPLTWRSRRGNLPLEKPVKKTAPVKAVNTPKTPAKRREEAPVAWPNVDLDQHGPVIVGPPPRITVPRRAVKLAPIYRRRGEPSWPTDDPDRPIVIVPPQRDRRGTVSTPDQMNRGAREQHFNYAATVATQAAQSKDLEAHRFLSLAGELDGVEGMEQVQQDHYQAAAASAHDAEVRRGMASIYGFLSEQG